MEITTKQRYVMPLAETAQCLAEHILAQSGVPLELPEPIIKDPVQW